MKMVIVPDTLRDAINVKLDAAFILTPEAEKDREHLFQQLLAFYDEHGYLPEFALSKPETSNA
jgi:hypothetical protein